MPKAKMNEICTRCIAQVEIHQISWKFDDSREINLKGSPVFIRLSLLGQTKSSRLFQPVFPLIINECVSVDRIFTNCKLEALLPEMLQDEQVSLELIQLKPDCTGGRILGRCHSSSYSFLFPENNKQFLIMSKSQRYQHSPCIQVTTSITITSTIVRSPLSIISPTTAAMDPALHLQNTITSTQKRLKKTTTPNNTITDITSDNNSIAKRVNLSLLADKEAFYTSTPNKRWQCDTCIIDKYLPSRSVAIPTSPYEMVQSKVDSILEHYSDKINAEENDSVSDEEDLIKSSFAAEREDTLNRTSQAIPNDSLLTQLGPTDYWSRQLAQYNNGESHRTVFNETMEKIYNRLYHRSKQ